MYYQRIKGNFKFCMTPENFSGASRRRHTVRMPFFFFSKNPTIPCRDSDTVIPCRDAGVGIAIGISIPKISHGDSHALPCNGKFSGAARSVKTLPASCLGTVKTFSFRLSFHITFSPTAAYGARIPPKNFAGALPGGGRPHRRFKFQHQTAGWWGGAPCIRCFCNLGR